MDPHKNEHTQCDQGSGTPGNAPDTDRPTPDANVGIDGQCITPQHPESVRENTGEPCDDGRDGGQN